MPESEKPSSHPKPNEQNASANPNEDVLERIRVVLKDPTYALYLEIELEKSGLLEPLEEAGVLPKDENPNPYNSKHQETLHDLWWEQHSQESEQYRQAIEQREEILNNIFIGLILRRLIDTPTI